MTTIKNRSRIPKRQRTATLNPPDLAAVLTASPSVLAVSQYQELSCATDRTVGRDAARL
jgi:hypothetical protein